MINHNYMAVPIEDTVIAYLDGRLNDADSAELLHRVSVSPEIRQMFQEHEALRQMSFRAARNAVLSPELEESLFARLAAIKESSDVIAPVPFWSMPRISAVVGVAAILLAGIVGSLELRNTPSISIPLNVSEVSHVNIVPLSDNTNSLPTSATVSPIIETKIQRHQGILDRTNGSDVADDHQGTELSVSSEVLNDERAIALLPASRIVEVAHITLPTSEHPTLESLRDLPMMSQTSDFEIGLSSPFSGFSVPGNMPQANLFSNVSLRFAYNLDIRNQLAMKLMKGGFAGLSPKILYEIGYMDVNGQLSMISGYAGELFYQRCEAVEHGLFFVTGAIGGGFYGKGSMLTAQVGLEVPIGDRFLGGVSLVVNRLHQNGSEASLLSGNEPVIYDGSNQYNTLAGSIEYGLTYRF